MSSNRLSASSSYWLCIVGPAFAALELLQLVLDARRLHPHLLPILIVVTFSVSAYIVYRIFRFLTEGLRLRRPLKQGPEREIDTVQEAKSLAYRFSRDTFGIGLAVGGLRLLLGT